MIQNGILAVMKNRSPFVFASLFFLSAIVSMPVCAQEQQAPVAAEQVAPAPVAAPSAATTASPANIGLEESEVTVMKDDFAGTEYVTPNMQNLSKLYWRLGIFNPQDRTAIDNYLIINECDVYQNFYKDDFEWANVRKATQQMLKEQAPTFPNQFKILVPVDLGRYDANRGGFDLVTKTAFVNSRRVQVTGSSSFFTECGQKGDLAGYPSRVVLILNKPFTFSFIKVDEHVAQAFLLRKRYNTTPMPRELRAQGFQRPAYARMRVTFVRYQGAVDEGGGRKSSILYGTLDGIDVFEDLHEEMLLTSVNYK